jgi:hypothetical protein
MSSDVLETMGMKNAVAALFHRASCKDCPIGVD